MAKPSMLVGIALSGALIVAIGGARGAAAQELSCGAANLGQAVCQAEGVSRCSYSGGGSITNQAPGYRWDCGLLHGKCMGSAPLPMLSRAVMASPPTRGPEGPPPSTPVRA